MNREELKKIGLSDEQIDKVMASHGKVVNSIKEKADQVDSLESQIEDYKQQIAERDDQLAELGKKVENNEELTAEIDRLKEENKTATEALQQKLDQQAFDFSLDRALTNAGVRNPKAVRALLDTESIKLDGEKLLGLDDQLEKIKETDDYLFQSDEGGNDPQIFVGGNPQGSNPTKNPFSKEHWNLTEQGRIYKENPELYKQLKSQAGK